MRFKRLLVGALGGALVVSSPLALSTNANAADDRSDAVVESADEAVVGDSTFGGDAMSDDAFSVHSVGPNARAAATTSRLAMQKVKKTYLFKTKFKVRGQIQAKGDGCSGGGWCYVNVKGDSVKVYRKNVGTKKWRLLATRPGNAKGRFSVKVAAKRNANYKVVYSGVGSIPPAAVSARINTARNPHVKAYTSHGKVYLKGKVAPGFKRKRVIVQRKTSKKGKFKKWAKPRTNKKGKFNVRLGAPKKGYWYFRLVVPKTNKKFVKTVSKTWRTYKRRR